MNIFIGKGSCGIAAGALLAEEVLTNGIKEKGIAAAVQTTGCMGMCHLEPIVDVVDDHGKKTTYIKVTKKVAEDILHAIETGTVAQEHTMQKEDCDSLTQQVRIALRNCGNINPEQISDYRHAGGYLAFEACLKEQTPQQIIETIKISGLAGRGGAGFPTWFKWNAARESVGEQKYVICNADEGDPGAFMDRAIIEGDPHTLIEGMLIAAYAIGASEGVVYVRAEYPLAIVRLENAILQAQEAGFLGKNILGSGFSFSLRIKAGAGAFVCGEETALIASLEGERGFPRLKPPFPAQKGLWQKPSNINNVETYANVPWILQHGANAFANIGAQLGNSQKKASSGTKVFALTGKIKKGGLVEIPMGRTLRDVIFGVGGGIKNNKRFKAVQLGGPSGGSLPESLLDTVIDYRELSATGAIMGSGGMVVMDEDTCMVDMARFFLDFTCKESCGKCVPCRIGTKRMLEIIERIVSGQGVSGDIELLLELGEQIKEGSLCGLGQTAPNPVLTAIRYFRNEFIDHIENKKCTAHQCQALLTYQITNKCIGCTLCKRNCPTAAISGETKGQHQIHADLCVKCGKCKEVCKFGAVEVQ